MLIIAAMNITVDSDNGPDELKPLCYLCMSLTHLCSLHYLFIAAQWTYYSGLSIKKMYALGDRHEMRPFLQFRYCVEIVDRFTS